MMENTAAIRIDVWSDYVCPWCYLELSELEELQQRLGTAVHLVWRAFELRPAPRPLPDMTTDEHSHTWGEVLYPLALQRGIALQQPVFRTRSRRAHEAAAYARAHGAFATMHAGLFRACFVEGRDIDQVQVLVELAVAAGLDGDDLALALEERRHTFEVDEDIELAGELGVSGVPQMVARLPGSHWDQARVIQGAVSRSKLEQALTEIDHTLFAALR